MSMPTRAHVGAERPDAVEHARHVDRHQPLERQRVGVGKRQVVGADAGIVDEDVDRAEPGLCRLLRPAPLVTVAHVERDGLKARPAIGDDGGEPRLVDVGDGHRHATRGQRFGDAQPHSAGATGYEHVPGRSYLHITLPC